MPRLAFREGDADGNDGDKDHDKFSKLSPAPPKFPVLESPLPPGADINIQPDPNAPQGDSLMCHNTPTKHASLSQVWWPDGPMRQLVHKHLKRCDKDYTHICVAPLESLYEFLVCNLTVKMSKDQKKNSSSWITLKLTDHVRIFHPSLKSEELYMATHSRNSGKLCLQCLQMVLDSTQKSRSLTTTWITPSTRAK